ncbi:hypothetical protein LSCM1_05337 [Leishmania martiniquensis]|uniref:Uncharacterized protein n=1 Tax=Leishmania martiniquensis TaxID=1580590 RepID=A0A836H8P3_9TRYP|nr:hypothetical protein LSCM1_05337 [Leishmania martiniquensis]
MLQDEVAPASVKEMEVPTRPVVIEADSVTSRYNFPAPADLEVRSRNNMAHRRRGRFVIKMAAALYLATLPAYDTPGKCAEAMSYLWGHRRLALEYLRRTQARQRRVVEEAEAPPYTVQQLRVAESKWKAHLGRQVLLPDGFQKSWDEILPFFVRCIQELEQHRALSRDHGGDTENGDAGASTAASILTTANSAASISTGLSAADQSGSRPLLPAPVPGAGPAGQGATAVSGTSAEAESAEQLLDLAKVPARALAILYDKTVRHLRLVSPARSAAKGCSTPEQHLASRGWLPLRQILSEISPGLKSDATLKALLGWINTLEERQREVIYLALLTPLNVLGKLQLLHDGDWDVDGVATGTAEMVRAAPVTHLRAAWGYEDASVAAAVMQEHIPVLLNSLAHASDADSGRKRALPPSVERHQSTTSDDRAGGSPYSSWLEYVDDAKAIRKEATGSGGRVYPQHRPMQVLIPAPVVDELCAPLKLARLQDDTPTGTALATFVRRSSAHVMSGADGTQGSSGTDAPSMVSYRELLTLLRPSSGFCVASFLAAMTGPATRLAFLPVSVEYFAAQGLEVSGWYMPRHMLRVNLRSASSEGYGSGGLAGEAMSPPSLMSGVTAVAAPRTVVTLLVCPSKLTKGVLWCRDEAAPTTPAPRASLRSLPPVHCVVDFDLLYGIHTDSESGAKTVTVCRPPTERVVNLRIASLWDIWSWHGFEAVPDGPLAAAAADSTKPPPCLMRTEEMGVVLGTQQRRPLPGPASGPHGTAPPPLSTCEMQPRGDGARAVCLSNHGQGDRAPETNETAPFPVHALLPLGAENLTSAATEETLTPEPYPLMHRLPWELFPVEETESTLLRLDAAYRAELHFVCERWRSRCLELLRPLRYGGYEEEEEETAHDSEGSACRAGGANMEHPETWRMFAAATARERALWSGLTTWMGRLDQECALPLFSLLLPPNVVLVAPSTEKDERRLCSVGRKRALAVLRRLVNGVDASSLFYFDAEVPFTPPLNPEVHRLWVMEGDEAWPPGTGEDALRPTDAASGDCGFCTISARSEALLATVRSEDGEDSVQMYVRQPCVLLRPRACRAVAVAPEAESSTMRRCSLNERGKEALRLCRFTYPSSAPGNDAASYFGASLEELTPHAALRHAHRGCRITPLACDEIMLGAAWPAEYIVEYALVPPLQEALEVYSAKKRAGAKAEAARGFGAHVEVGRAGNGCGSNRAALTAAVPDVAERQLMINDLRRELYLVLTDEAAMDMCEFYGDALVDYCAAASTLSYRLASSNSTLWRGGNITGSSTNGALVVSVLPAVLRRYWMSRRRICNSKRLADCIESLFGALAKALWVYPLQRMRLDGVGEEGLPRHPSAASTISHMRADAIVPPDADMLVYAASALLELLSCCC